MTDLRELYVISNKVDALESANADYEGNSIFLRFTVVPSSTGVLPVPPAAQFQWEAIDRAARECPEYSFFRVDYITLNVVYERTKNIEATEEPAA